jgi:LysM repeat protein
VSGRETSGERGPPPSPCLGPHGAGSTGFWIRSGIKKFKSKCWKGKLRVRNRLAACQTKLLMPTFGTMKLAAMFCAAVFSGGLLLSTASAQTPSPEPVKTSDSPQLEALIKKIDEQNTKIDALSQEILKLEQQISHIRPGVMIGESTPAANTSVAPAGSPSHPMSGNTHTVARGETLTSIAKMYKVGIDELQKTNNIEDGRKLQAGQTIVIPGSPSPTPSSSPPTD